MTHDQIHSQLIALCDGIVTAYRDDLLVHDKRNIEQHDASVPFLHFSRGTGTYMVHLIAASEYPAKGKLVPFLFGTADRDHCLDSVTDMVEHCCNPMNGRHVCHYWNGKQFKQITLALASIVATEYVHLIRQAWMGGVDGGQEVTSYVALGM